jgi:hypothetical protein
MSYSDKEVQKFVQELNPNLLKGREGRRALLAYEQGIELATPLKQYHGPRVENKQIHVGGFEFPPRNVLRMSYGAPSGSPQGVYAELFQPYENSAEVRAEKHRLNQRIGEWQDLNGANDLQNIIADPVRSRRSRPAQRLLRVWPLWQAWWEWESAPSRTAKRTSEKTF